MTILNRSVLFFYIIFFPTISLANVLRVREEEECTPIYVGVPNPHPLPDAKAPAIFNVSFFSSISDMPIILEVTRLWAPLGVDRFYQLTLDNYYNCAGFFRVVPDFVVQFGIAAESEETAKWNTNIKDDPVIMSNIYGTVSFATAGPDTRTTQVFINTADNSHLDDSGFSPFARVVSGMAVVLNLNNPTPGDSNGVDQDEYTEGGNQWLLESYPNISLIVSQNYSENYFVDAGDEGSKLLDLFWIAIMVFLGVAVVITCIPHIYWTCCSKSCMTEQQNSYEELSEGLSEELSEEEFSTQL